MITSHKNNGFTLFEMMLSLALLGVIAGLSVPLYQSFQNQNELTITSTTLAQTVRQAQGLARANKGDTNWGVYIQPGEIVLFSGLSFADRDDSLDIIFGISESIDVSGKQEYIFEKMTGKLQDAGETIFVNRSSQERIVSINSWGMVDF